MRPTAIVCGTAMLICYSVLGTIYDMSFIFLLPLGLAGFVTLAAGFGAEREVR